MTERHELWTLLDQAQMDIRALSAKLVQIRSYVAGLDLPDRASVTCDTCGLRFRGPYTLAEHVYNSHDGPVPQHILDAEARALAPTTSDR